MTNAVYLRISNDPLKLLAGVERQRVDCVKLAEQKFPDQPIQFYEDNDRSAYSTARRPAWDRMLADIKAHQVTSIVAYNIDRLVRQPRQLEDLIDLKIPVVTASGDLDLTTHDGQMHARILVTVAKKSSDDTSRRVKRHIQDRSEAGKWPGPMPYPYVQRNSIAVARSQPSLHIARRAVDMFLAGHSIRAIARACGAADPLAPQTSHGWRAVLKSPALAGLNPSGFSGAWPAVISTTQHLELRHILANPTRRTHTHPGSRDRTYWLSGIVQCSKCERPMYPATEWRSGVAVVRCQSCGMVIRRAYLDGAVQEMLFAIAPPSATPPAVDPLPSETVPEIRLPELAALYVQGKITREVWESALAAQPPDPPVPQFASVDLPEDLRSAWPEMMKSEPHRCHEIARRYLFHVDVLSAPRNGGKFDLGRVRGAYRPDPSC